MPSNKNLVYWIIGIVILLVILLLFNSSQKSEQTDEGLNSFLGELFSGMDFGDEDETETGDEDDLGGPDEEMDDAEDDPDGLCILYYDDLGGGPPSCDPECLEMKESQCGTSYPKSCGAPTTSNFYEDKDQTDCDDLVIDVVCLIDCADPTWGDYCTDAVSIEECIDAAGGDCPDITPVGDSFPGQGDGSVIEYETFEECKTDLQELQGDDDTDDEECEGDEDCTEDDAQYCLGGGCVECLEQAHCSGSTPYCNLVGSCVSSS